MMKHLFKLIVILLMISNACNAQDIFSRIREQYKAINLNEGAYRLLEKNLMGESSEGGSVVAFVDSTGSRKIIATFFGETGKLVTEYYFDHAELIFAFSQEYHYNGQIPDPNIKVASIKQERYYFSNKKMIRWLDGNNEQRAGSQDYENETRDVLKESRRMFNYMSFCNAPVKKNFSKDTVRCVNGVDCFSTGYIIKGSRNACGEAIHVDPKNKKVKME